MWRTDQKWIWSRHDASGVIHCAHFLRTHRTCCLQVSLWRCSDVICGATLIVQGQCRQGDPGGKPIARRIALPPRGGVAPRGRSVLTSVALLRLVFSAHSVARGCSAGSSPVQPPAGSHCAPPGAPPPPPAVSHCSPGAPPPPPAVSHCSPWAPPPPPAVSHCSPWASPPPPAASAPRRASSPEPV